MKIRCCCSLCEGKITFTSPETYLAHSCGELPFTEPEPELLIASVESHPSGWRQLSLFSELP